MIGPHVGVLVPVSGDFLFGYFQRLHRSSQVPISANVSVIHAVPDRSDGIERSGVYIVSGVVRRRLLTGAPR
jgi:hypothetical protein